MFPSNLQKHGKVARMRNETERRGPSSRSSHRRYPFLFYPQRRGEDRPISQMRCSLFRRQLIVFAVVRVHPVPAAFAVDMRSDRQSTIAGALTDSLASRKLRNKEVRCASLEAATFAWDKPKCERRLAS